MSRRRTPTGADATRSGRPATPPTGWALPIGVGVGAGFGVVAGILIGQITLGTVFGAATGLVAGASLTTLGAVPPERRRAVAIRACAILAAGVAVTVVALQLV